MENIRIHRDDFVWLLGSWCNVHRLPFDARLMLSQFPPPYSTEKLAAAADALGLETRPVIITRVGNAYRVEALPTPFVALSRELNGLKATPAQEASENSPIQAGKMALVVRADAEKVLLFRAGEQSPITLSSAEFETEYRDNVLVGQPKQKEAKDDDAVSNGTGSRCTRRYSSGHVTESALG